MPLRKLRKGVSPVAGTPGDSSHAGGHAGLPTSVPPKISLRDIPRRRRPPPAKASSAWALVLFILMVLGGLGWVTWQEMEEKVTSEKYNLTLAALDKAFLGCKVYWKEQGFYKPCTQFIVDKFYSERDESIRVTVVRDRQTNFTATATHVESNKVFQVDREGTIFLKEGDCLVKVPFYTLTSTDLASLESKCASNLPVTTMPPPMPAF